MTRVHKLMQDGQDKTPEVIELLLKIGIKEDMIERFSLLIIMQIYGTFMSGAENPVKIIEEILHLEGFSRRGESCTKPSTKFERKPYLRGLWHKHYIGSNLSDMAKTYKLHYIIMAYRN